MDYLREIKRIAGRFLRVSENPAVVGLIGNVCAEDLTENQINHIKGFCNIKSKEFIILNDYPVKLNRGIYNNFILFKEEKTDGI